MIKRAEQTSRITDKKKMDIGNKKDWIMPGKMISMELSSYCDANCIFCPWGKDFSLKNKNMEFDLFKKCIDEAVLHGVTVLDTSLMGNAFLDPGLEKKLSYCREQYPTLKIYFSSTCGTNMDFQFIAQYIDTLHISMYGMTKKVYESIHRGGLKFEKVINNIEEILRLPKKERPYIILTFLLLPENEHQMEEWKSKWEGSADEITIWKPHNWGGRYLQEPPSCEAYGHAKTCGRPFNDALCVWVNGDVSVCCISEDKKLVVGNIGEQTFEEIVFGERRKKILEIHKKNDFYQCGLPCEKCDQIFDRSDALVYTSKNRALNAMIVSGDYIHNIK